VIKTLIILKTVNVYEYILCWIIISHCKTTFLEKHYKKLQREVLTLYFKAEYYLEHFDVYKLNFERIVYDV